MKKALLVLAVLMFAFGFPVIGCTGTSPTPAPLVPAPAGPLRPVPPSPYDPAPSPAPAPSDVVQQLLDAHNKERAAHKLPPLKLNAKLQKAAQAHSDWQAKVHLMAHMLIGDGTPFSRIDGTGYKWSSAGENVAWNQPDVATVMKDWMWSPGHRANILSPNYTEAGFAVTELYWTVDFGTPLAPGAPALSKPTVTGNASSISSRR